MRLWNNLLKITCLLIRKNPLFFHLCSFPTKIDVFLHFTKKHDKEDALEAGFKDLEQENIVNSPSDSSVTGSLKNNTDLLACKSEYYHQCSEYKKCFELTSQ